MTSSRVGTRSMLHGAQRILVVVGLAVGVLSLGMGMFFYSQALSTLGRYTVLAEEIGSKPLPHQNLSDKGTGGPVLSAALPSNAVAWVSVTNTSIDLPVASGDRGLSWYLSHDLWGHETDLGCPFMDPHCLSADDRHVIVYGHHLSLTNAMFSPLYRCYQPGKFARLGPCVWKTSSGTITLAPLCSLSVRDDWPDIMRFTFADDESMRAWLGRIVTESTAKNPDSKRLLLGAHRVVTLVTCSSNFSGQPWRTLVLFVG